MGGGGGGRLVGMGRKGRAAGEGRQSHKTDPSLFPLDLGSRQSLPADNSAFGKSYISVDDFGIGILDFRTTHRPYLSKRETGAHVGPKITTVFCLPGHLTTHSSPEWEAADAEIKVPFVENTKLKRSPFEAWSRSV